MLLPRLLAKDTGLYALSFATYTSNEFALAELCYQLDVDELSHEGEFASVDFPLGSTVQSCCAGWGYLPLVSRPAIRGDSTDRKSCKR